MFSSRVQFALSFEIKVFEIELKRVFWDNFIQFSSKEMKHSRMERSINTIFRGFSHHM